MELLWRLRKIFSVVIRENNYPQGHNILTYAEDLDTAIPSKILERRIVVALVQGNRILTNILRQRYQTKTRHK